MAEAWKIQRRQGACADTGREFADGEEVFSLLRLQEGVLQRVDLSRAAFDARDTDADIVWWRTVHRVGGGGGQIKADFDLLLAAMETLTQDPREDRRDLGYLLALLLVRHRKLRLERVEMRKSVEHLVLRKVRSQINDTLAVGRFVPDIEELEQGFRDDGNVILQA